MFKKIKKIGVLAVAFVLTSCSAPTIMGDLKKAVNDVSASSGQINSSLKIEEYTNQKTSLEEQLKTFKDDKDKMIQEGQTTEEDYEKTLKKYEQVLQLDSTIMSVKPEDLKVYYINGSKNNMYAGINVLEFKSIPEDLKKFDFATMNTENEESVKKEIENLKASKEIFASQVGQEPETTNTEAATETTAEPTNTEAATETTAEPTNTEPATETAVEPTNTEAATETAVEPTNIEAATETAVEATNTEVATETSAEASNTEPAETSAQEPMKPEDIVKMYDQSIQQAEASRTTIIQKGNYLIIISGVYNNSLEQINKVLDSKIK